MDVVEQLELLSSLFRDRSRINSSAEIDINVLIKRLISVATFDELTWWLRLKNGVLPVELLSSLVKHKLLQLTTYIHFFPDEVPSLVEGLANLAVTTGPECQHSREVLSPLLTALINIGAYSQREVYKMAQAAMHMFVDKIVDRLACDESGAALHYIGDMCDSYLFCSGLRRFMIAHIQSLLGHTRGVPLETAVGCQATRWTVAKAPLRIGALFKQIFEHVTTDEAFSEISRCVLTMQFNWKYLLIAISTFVTMSSSSAEMVKNFTDSLLSGVPTLEPTLVACGVMMARQACAEGVPPFNTYVTWFGSLKIRSPIAFTELFRFLTRIVPCEPIICLKIHVNKVPHAPSTCHYIISDYNTLARTQLADLNETTDYIGLFGEHTTDQDGRQLDVARVISHFEQTGEIISTVLEASIFRRQYYERVFVPDLLARRRGEEVAHTTLVEKMFALGKISYGMYTTWSQQ